MASQDKNTNIKWFVGILVTIMVVVIGAGWKASIAADEKLDDAKLDKSVFDEHKESDKKTLGFIKDSLKRIEDKIDQGK